ncbi:MAG: hypothetical protein M0T74_01060 [Desulfitobacterium hafniense]|nr:hypothetical protein [Desulfitobacterium hafniense]
MLQNVGFKDIRLTPKDNSSEIVKSWAPDKNIEEFVASYIIEATKEEPEVSKPCCTPSSTGKSC